MEQKYEKYLPIGTVVLLKEGKKRVMIIGYGVIAKDSEFNNKLWDYAACLYPNGFFRSDKNLVFDHEQIAEVFALGYSDEEEKSFRSTIGEKIETNYQKFVDSKIEKLDE